MGLPLNSTAQPPLWKAVHLEKVQPPNEEPATGKDGPVPHMLGGQPPQEDSLPGEGSAPQLLDEQLAAVLHWLHIWCLPGAMFVPGPLFLDCGGDRRGGCSMHSSYPTLEAPTHIRGHPGQASQSTERKLGSSTTPQPQDLSQGPCLPTPAPPPSPPLTTELSLPLQP